MKPAKLKAKLVGEYTKGRRLSIKIDEDQSTPLELRSTRRYERRDGTTERETTSTGADSVNMFEEALRSQLKPTADGGFEWSPPDIDHGRGGYTRMRIWLRPAKD